MADPSNETYAIVEASGQQFWLQPNRYYDLDRLQAGVDETVTLENVLLVKDAKGSVQSPKSVDFVEAIPLTPVGKPDKKAVRAQYWEGSDRGVG